MFAMGALAIAYVVMRPSLASRVRHLGILEFPAGAALVAAFLWASLARRKPEPAPRWRRHEQIVRPLPDPALTPAVAVLERWIETGEASDEAARVVARAATTDEGEQQALAARLAKDMTLTSSRKKRGSFLNKHLNQGV
ncbi:MAG TPA: hypothetical protein VM370_00630 [Candidatus Thermoplasmatota archaeon]|nr:hypothetical protein [Candidatus Thermoplasmatota archaeon]